MSKAKEGAVVWTVGSLGYPLIELAWRGCTSWTMALTGGVCFWLLYRFSAAAGRLRLWQRCLAGGGLITAVEFAAGCLFNRLCRMDVWDYSQQPFNLQGQVCLLYSVLWCLLCLPALALCGWLRTRLNPRHGQAGGFML